MKYKTKKKYIYITSSKKNTQWPVLLQDDMCYFKIICIISK